MSSRPWYPWYPANFRAKTAQLNAAQKGAYRELLDEIYITRKGLPDDNKVLAKVCHLTSKKWQNVRPHLEPFFIIRDGYWYHVTAHEIMTKQKIINQSFSERGKAGAAKRWNGKIVDSLANGLANLSTMARPMANKKLDIKELDFDLNHPTRVSENQSQKLSLKKSKLQTLTPEQRQAEITELHASIAECEKVGKLTLASELKAKLLALQHA